MKNIEFKKKGLLYELYLMTFLGKTLPDNTCSYKLRLIISLAISVALYPITICRIFWRILTTIPNRWKYDRETHVLGWGGFIIGAVEMIVITIIGMGVLGLIYDMNMESEENTKQILMLLSSYLLVNLIVLWLIGALTALIVVLVIAGVIWLIVERIVPWINSLFSGSSPIKIEREPTTQFGVMKQSLIERWCKKITWK